MSEGYESEIKKKVFVALKEFLILKEIYCRAFLSLKEIIRADAFENGYKLTSSFSSYFYSTIVEDL